ncbi:hypothetical protein COP1_007232 [Malus domestica]
MATSVDAALTVDQQAQVVAMGALSMSPSKASHKEQRRLACTVTLNQDSAILIYKFSTIFNNQHTIA